MRAWTGCLFVRLPKLRVIAVVYCAPVVSAPLNVKAGQLFVPEQAHWAANVFAEPLSFPRAAFDHQVDAIT